MPRNVGPVTPGTPIDINISSLTPHTVIAYKLWWRSPDTAAWSLVGEGDTGDQQPDYWTVTPGSNPGQLYYWIGVGSKNPNESYDALMTLGQGGQILSGGNVHVAGVTNAQEVAVVEDWVNAI
jgi:hypothetical protein